MRKVTVEVPPGTLGDAELVEIIEQAPAPSACKESDRARRLLALSKVFGLWKHRADIPADGLEYERFMRSE